MAGPSDLQATQYVISLFEKSKTHSEAALESLPGIYAVIDAVGNILKGNRNLATFYDVDHELLLNQNFFKILPPEDAKKIQAIILQLQKGETSSVEFETRTLKNDNTFNFLCDLSPLIIDPKATPTLFTLVGRDVTQLTLVTAEKTRMAMELNTARMVQERLFQSPSAKFGAASVAGYYEPANECGGDWWHYSYVDDKVYLWIGDVTGY
jgi:PAS domain S-box-containing protein